MGMRYLEIKKEEPEREFIFYVSSTYRILHWEEASLDVEQVRNYFKENPLEDKIFNKEDFLTDLESEGFIAIYCEKEETAEYIADMLYELV